VEYFYFDLTDLFDEGENEMGKALQHHGGQVRDFGDCSKITEWFRKRLSKT
jgi:Uri superfamily endonuclease